MSHATNVARGVSQAAQCLRISARAQPASAKAAPTCGVPVSEETSIMVPTASYGVTCSRPFDLITVTAAGVVSDLMNAAAAMLFCEAVPIPAV